MMDFQDCVKFANENPLCYVATAEGDQPRVRAINIWFADDKGFYFQTESVKAFCKQLENNPKIEVCFYAPGADAAIGKIMRVAGEVEFISGTAIKRRVLEERPFLKGMGIEKPEDPLLVVFRIYTGEAFFWTMECNMRESEIERIRF